MKKVLSWERISRSLEDFQLNWLKRRRANDYTVALFNFAVFAWNL